MKYAKLLQFFNFSQQQLASDAVISAETMRFYYFFARSGPSLEQKYLKVKLKLILKLPRDSCADLTQAEKKLHVFILYN